MFSSLQGTREEGNLPIFFEKVKASKQKLEIYNLELP